MLAHGVIARAMSGGDIIGFAPPPCLVHEEADEIVRVTTEPVLEVCGG